jgi:hypothetical protein
MQNITTIEFNDELCTFSAEVRPRGTHDKGRHTYVSVSCDFDPEDIHGSGFTNRPEYSIKGEDLAKDKLWKKYNRFEVATQKKLIQKAIDLGMIPVDVLEGLTFSRKAGCACGCSPGWKSRDYRRRDVWINLVSPVKEQEREQELQEYRQVQEEKTLASMVI